MTTPSKDRLRPPPPGPDEPPRPTGKAPELVDITGYILPVDDARQPAWLHCVGMGLVLPVFSTMAALDLACRHYPLNHTRLQRIDDGHEFVRSIPEDVPIVIDVRPSDRGTVLFTLVQRVGDWQS